MIETLTNCDFKDDGFNPIIHEHENKQPVIDNYEGTKWNRLTAIRFHHQKRYSKYWVFRCDCGKEKIAQISHVIHGSIKSCGCLRKEQTAQNQTG